MSTVILKGHDALHYAESHHQTVNCASDKHHAERRGMSVNQARAIAEYHPELVWIEIRAAVNTAEPMYRAEPMH